MKKVLALIMALSLLCFNGCGYNQRMRSYYTDKENYITVTATVSNVNYTEYGLYIAFSEMSESFDDDNFKIIGENYDLVVERGIEEQLSVGKTISYITAPRYFGDGYVMPIVSITIDNVVYLEFEEGYDNLLQTL